MLLLAPSQPVLIRGWGNHTKLRLHPCMARSANLAAQDRIGPGRNGSEVDMEDESGHRVLLEAHGRNEEAVNDVQRAEKQVDFASCRKHENGGHQVIGS